LPKEDAVAVKDNSVEMNKAVEIATGIEEENYGVKKEWAYFSIFM